MSRFCHRRCFTGLQMNPHQLKRLFPDASASVLAANAHDYGKDHADSQLPDAEQRERATPLARRDEGEAQGAGCPLVRFTLYRVKLLDVDAKYSSVKDLLDGLQHAGLIRGDKEGEINLEVRQTKVASYAEERTVIEIERCTAEP